MGMNNLFTAAYIGLLTISLAPVAAIARPMPEQDAILNNVRNGVIRPFPEMLARARGNIGGAELLGSEFDAGTGRYRFKFQRGNSVIWMDMDGRTGRELGRVGE